jgi:methyl-accepting chemotaxis protein
MSAGQLAALIAAGFFAVGVCAGVYVLFRLARLISLATTVLTGYKDATDSLVARAQATVDRADEQLARTRALSDSVDAVTDSMADLSEQVSAVAGTAGLIASGIGQPVLRLAAASHGVRRAIALRRGGRVTELPVTTRAGS